MTVLKKVCPFSFRRRSVNHAASSSETMICGMKADDPQDQRVAEILGQVGGEQGDVVFQAHKAGADDLQAAAVIFKKAVVDGGCQRDQLEYREDDKERRNEDVAPFRVADRPFLFRFLSHRIRPPVRSVAKAKRAGEICRPPLCYSLFRVSELGHAAIMRARPPRSARGTSP